MKKQELIHLHGLLRQVQEEYEEKTGDVIEHDEYDTLGVKSTSIHKSKTDHKNAVLTLSQDIAGGMAPTLAFEDEDLLSGSLEPRVKNESKLASIFANLAKGSPKSVLNSVPILLSFIRNGDISTQRHAVQAVDELAEEYPQKINKYSDEFRKMADYIHEINLKNDLQSTIERTRAQVAESQ